MKKLSFVLLSVAFLAATPPIAQKHRIFLVQHEVLIPFLMEDTAENSL